MKEKITVALIYDFDGTLAPGNMQEYDFIPAVGKSNMEFWHEANTLAEEQDADQVLTYMARMIQAAQSKGLSLRREAFRESGRNVKFYRGVEEWFGRINRGHKHRPRVQEHLRLLVPLQCRRHSLLARGGGELHQQDAVHLQD